MSHSSTRVPLVSRITILLLVDRVHFWWLVLNWETSGSPSSTLLVARLSQQEYFWYPVSLVYFWWLIFISGVLLVARQVHFWWLDLQQGTTGTLACYSTSGRSSTLLVARFHIGYTPSSPSCSFPEACSLPGVLLVSDLLVYIW